MTVSTGPATVAATSGVGITAPVTFHSTATAGATAATKPVTTQPTATGATETAPVSNPSTANDATTSETLASSASPTDVPAAVNPLAGVLSLFGVNTLQEQHDPAAAGGTDHIDSARGTSPPSIGVTRLSDVRQPAGAAMTVSRVTSVTAAAASIDTVAVTTRSVASPSVTTPSVAAASAMVAPASSVGPAGVLSPVVNLLAGVLSLFGLNTAQAPSNPLGALVWEVFRRVESTLGVVPVAGQPTVSTPTSEGVVTGSVGFSAPAGLALSYTASTDAGQGVVSVGADGSFTYTPTEAARSAAGAPGAPAAASFAVTASDGLAATTTTISVPVSPFQPGTVIATIPVGHYPNEVALSPDGKHAYVVNDRDGTVSVIDTATNTVSSSIAMFPGYAPFGVAVSPNGKYVYVTANTDVQGGDKVSVIDTATNTIVASIAVGIDPRGVAVSPDGKYAYVANLGDGTITVIDTATNTTNVPIIPAGFQPLGMAVSPDGKYIYVTNSGDGTVSVLDTATYHIVATVPVGGNDSIPSHMAVGVTSHGTYVYVTSNGGPANPVGGTVSVIDTATNTNVAEIPVVHGYPESVAISPDGRYAYVTNLMLIDATHGYGTISVIDTATNTTVGNPIALGSLFPGGVAVSGDGSLAYVSTVAYDYTTDTGEGTVSVIYTGNWVAPQSAD